MNADQQSAGRLARVGADHRSGDPAVRRRQRRRARRRAIRRRRLTAALGLAALLLAGLASLLAGGGGSGAPSGLAAHAAHSQPPAGEGAVAGTPGLVAQAVSHPAGTAGGSPSPGSLPQTSAFPSGRSSQFRALMADLWAGVVHDSVASALPAFFPRGAYVQLKAIYSAGSDWSERLVRDYRLDIGAAHALLGAHAGRARLLGVEVPASYGHWVAPGACYNSIGYYELPDARVVYRENGAVHSFGIASMISWRGVWYVVHLGAILRSGEAGEVDEPASGPGTPVYSGTC